MGSNGIKMEDNEIKNFEFYRTHLITRIGRFGPNTKWKLSQILTNKVCEFLSYNDMKIIGNINIIFRNIYVNYSYKWEPYLIYVLKPRYNLEISEKEIDYNFSEANKLKRTYKIKNDEGLYLLIENNSLNFIKLANSSKWAWKDDIKYWVLEDLPNAYLNQSTPVLNYVFYCNVNFSFNKIIPSNYSLYLHQAFPELMENSLNLDILVDGIIKFNSDYPNKETGYKKGMDLKECYICDIKISDFDLNKKEHEVKVQFMHKHLYGISGWYIDGGKLVEKRDLDLYFN